MTVNRVFTEGEVHIREPSVLGFTGNYAKNPNLFVGNWLYQDAEHEGVDNQILEDQMHHVLTLLGKNRPNHARPKTIIVLRDGISEPQYEKFIVTELQAMKKACHRVSPDYKPKFVCIVTTKEHDTRVFYRNNDGKIENPIPGTVIDYGVVRRGPEFLIIPHKAIKGTAQPVYYSVLVNEASIPQTGIQKFVHALSYTHQLTCSPTALPEPIYQVRVASSFFLHLFVHFQADILAKRGLSTLQIFKSNFPTAVPRQPTQQYDIEGLNKRLTFRDHQLEQIRFTA